MTKPKISVHCCRKCRFDFENGEKIVGGGRGKLAKSRGRNRSSPVCLSWPYRFVNPLVTRHPHRVGGCVTITTADSRTLRWTIYTFANPRRRKAEPLISGAICLRARKHLFDFTSITKRMRRQCLNFQIKLLPIQTKFESWLYFSTHAFIKFLFFFQF